MAKCVYCNRVYPEHQGVLVVDSITGALRYFCSGKCRKYFVMGRKKGKWTSKISSLDIQEKSEDNSGKEKK